jgi:hypothetical protein
MGNQHLEVVMLNWLKSILLPKPPKPLGPPQLVHAVPPEQVPLTRDHVLLDGDAWRIHADAPGLVRLYDIELPRLEQCMLTYRLRLKSQDVVRGAYLEMWCRVAGMGEFFSKGLTHRVRGTTDWSEYEIPFYLKKAQQADLLKLGVTFQGPGTVWVKEVQVFQTPLEA